MTSMFSSTTPATATVPPLTRRTTATCLLRQYRGQIDAEIRLNEADYTFGFEAAAAGERASRVRLSPKSPRG